MKEQVKMMYRDIHMPVETEEKIRQAILQPTVRRNPAWKRAMAAVIMLALILTLSPTVCAAVNGWMVKYFWPDSDLTIYEMTDENGEAVGIAAVHTDVPAFARMVNGRLFFVGNGEKLDITDQITEKIPYYYTHVDDYGLTHYMAVGFSGSIENFGIYEFIRDENSGEWITGSGRNYLDPKTETRYPWVELVWDHYNIPWPMPE